MPRSRRRCSAPSSCSAGWPDAAGRAPQAALRRLPLASPRSMTSLARFCFTHKKRVIALWLLVLVVLGGLSGAVGSGYSDSFTLPGTESTRALNLLQQNFKQQSGDQDRIVWHVTS